MISILFLYTIPAKLFPNIIFFISLLEVYFLTSQPFALITLTSFPKFNPIKLPLVIIFFGTSLFKIYKLSSNKQFIQSYKPPAQQIKFTLVHFKAPEHQHQSVQAHLSNSSGRVMATY